LRGDDLVGVDIVFDHVNRTCEFSFHKELHSASGWTR
jgi:hypothetical protein